MSLQFGFVILWQKAFGAKAALKMLVKLTPGHTDWQQGRKKRFIRSTPCRPIFCRRRRFSAPFRRPV